MFCFSRLEICLMLLPRRPVVFWSICRIRFCWLDVSKPVWPCCQLRFKGEENPHHRGQAWIKDHRHRWGTSQPGTLADPTPGQRVRAAVAATGGLVVWVPHGGETLSVPPNHLRSCRLPCQLHPHSWPRSTAARGSLPNSETSATSSHSLLAWFLHSTLSTFLQVVPAPFSSALLPPSPPPRVPGSLRPCWVSPTPLSYPCASRFIPAGAHRSLSGVLHCSLCCVAPWVRVSYPSQDHHTCLGVCGILIRLKLLAGSAPPTLRLVLGEWGQCLTDLDFSLDLPPLL